jgi:2-oxoglutarate dehydrogenase E2 component (dihydrolipoamide succinyltransferase)
VHDLTIPKFNSNDATYVLTEWLFADGDVVPAGADVALVETSKATQELACDEGGILEHRLGIRQECKPGQVIGHLFADEAERRDGATRTAGGEDATDPAEPVLTAPARELAERNGIPADALRALGRKVIRRTDVEELLAARPAAVEHVHVPSRGQRAVAEVVDRSHRTIPAAYAVVDVSVDHAVDELRRYGERTKVTAGLPELLVLVVAGLRERFPLPFATLR